MSEAVFETSACNSSRSTNSLVDDVTEAECFNLPSQDGFNPSELLLQGGKFVDFDMQSKCSTTSGPEGWPQAQYYDYSRRRCLLLPTSRCVALF